MGRRNLSGPDGVRRLREDRQHAPCGGEQDARQRILPAADHDVRRHRPPRRLRPSRSGAGTRALLARGALRPHILPYVLSRLHSPCDNQRMASECSEAEQSIKNHVKPLDAEKDVDEETASDEEGTKERTIEK
ncbi:hypothetical protein L596_022125 [Steinernema carpocapsae]|uniref:Uncharacterized protein n=1 Tax=Steinernema carpocapsae TaxID=34508 RepID=A0A4U5MKW4_STECR|nr:hypothetical protein L596_022125 [Steinernema carpocapsae]